MTDKPFLRNNFLEGMSLTPEDLHVEQTYFREKHRLHNRSLHGFGIVSGLEVDQRRNQLVITPGLALDCQGNEILVAEPVELTLPETLSATSIFLCIRYSEREAKPASTKETSQGSWERSRVADSFVTTFENHNVNQRHRHVMRRWQACGKPHGLVLARLRCTSGQWRLDRRMQRPSLK